MHSERGREMTMYPMNNPMAALINAARTGCNPMQLIQNMAGQDPQMRQAMQMIQGKNPQQLRQMAENMARERGTSLDAVIKQLGF